MPLWDDDIRINLLRPSNMFTHKIWGHHWWRQQLVQFLVPRHNIQWNFIQNTTFIKQNWFNNVNSKIPAILSQSQCVIALSPGSIVGFSTPTSAKAFKSFCTRFEIFRILLFLGNYRFNQNFSYSLYWNWISSNNRNTDKIAHIYGIQWSFCDCAQPMKDDVRV